MRSSTARCLAGLWFVLMGANLLRAQTPPAPMVEGTVTLVDSNRQLFVVQERSSARAFKVNGGLPDIHVGERVAVEGSLLPFLSAFPDYPDRAAGRHVLESFSAPADGEDHFLARFRAWLRAPADGSYTFWIAADDEAELFFSSGADEARAAMIASVSSATGQDEWEREPGQKSKAVSLKAGEAGYIEARQREWRGHDHLSVAWQGPGFDRRVIGGEFLTAYGTGTAPTNGVLREYWTNCFITRLSVILPGAQETALVKLANATVKSLGEGALPSPKRVPLDRPWTEGRDFSWVEVEGVANFVTSDNARLTVELVETGNRRGESLARMTVQVLDAREYPAASLNNRKLRVRGVCERVLDENGAPAGAVLWVPGPEQIDILEFSDRDARDLDALPMFDLVPSNLNLAWRRKVLVRGTVTAYDSKSGRASLRGDDSFCAYRSPDGKNWSAIGVPVPIAMGESIYAGLVAASVSETSAMAATFSRVSPDLSAAKITGLGGSARGRAVFTNDGVILRPLEGNAWDSQDKGLFVCRRLDAEGEMVAQLQGFATTRISDKAGLMMRETLNADSPYVALVMTHGTRLDLQYRSARRLPSKAVDRGASELPQWLKLTRRQHTLAVQMLAGEKARLRQHVELVGLLEWQGGEPVLKDAYVRSTARLEQAAPAVAETRESRIADLPTATAESEQYLGENYLIRGVVTFAGRAFGRDLLFLQDDSGAALIRASPVSFRSSGIEPGQLVEAKGDVQFSPGLSPFRLNTSAVLGWGQFPRPLPYPDRTKARQTDSHWVELPGVVRSATNNLLRVMAEHGLVSVWIGGLAATNSLAQHVDDLVTVRGVFSTQVAPEPVVLVPSLRCVEVTEPAPADPFLLPAFPINKVAPPAGEAAWRHRIKIAGVVTYRDENSLVLQDQTAGAWVHGGVPAGLKVGARVEAVGFPDQQGELVTLRESLVRQTGEGEPPVPIQMMMDGLLDSHLNSWLVCLEGVVLEQKSREGRQRLELQNGQRVFEAVLANASGRLDALPVGSRVKVTGVTQLQVAGHSPDPGTDGASSLVATMEILLRTPADLELIERPPWWTWRHTAFVGGLLLAVLGGAFVWIRVLRRRVAQRTGELRIAMGRLKKEAELSATLAERERLAAEIHDTLEQGLSGIMMQLDGVDSRLGSDQAGARENLEMARRMVRFSRAEVRHSLWNLESQLLKDGDLGAAIREIARQMSVGCASAVTVEVSPGGQPLPAAVDHHLLRCTQEAVSNALKHAGAANVRVTLNYGDDTVELTVKDDGCGFDPGQAMTAAGMHLGMRNLRSRARKMKGQLRVESQPGQGTAICLVVPLKADREKNKTSPPN
ncbi:MAG: histidine kinase [Verrucomicrobiota bacterium]